MGPSFGQSVILRTLPCRNYRRLLEAYFVLRFKRVDWKSRAHTIGDIRRRREQLYGQLYPQIDVILRKPFYFTSHAYGSRLRHKVRWTKVSLIVSMKKRIGCYDSTVLLSEVKSFVWETFSPSEKFAKRHLLVALIAQFQQPVSPNRRSSCLRL